MCENAAMMQEHRQSQGPRQALPWLGLVLLVIFTATCFTPLAEVIALVQSERPSTAGADAIVALAGAGTLSPGVLSGSSLRRAITAIEHYRDGRAPLLVFSGGPDEGKLRRELATRLGVSTGAIAFVEGARNTYEEAARIGPLLRAHGAQTVLLVTDTQHMHRAARVFRRQGFQVLPLAADHIGQLPQSAEGRLILLRQALHERLAFLYYAVLGYV